MHGRKHDPSTVRLPGNLHRALSDAQLDHPEEIRNATRSDPFLWLAAGILGLHDHLDWWVRRLEVIAHFFVDVSTWVRTHVSDEEAIRDFPPLFGMTLR
jgi:hypothetical protein